MQAALKIKVHTEKFYRTFNYYTPLSFAISTIQPK